MGGAGDSPAASQIAAPRQRSSPTATRTPDARSPFTLWLVLFVVFGGFGAFRGVNLIQPVLLW
jgi:hypothetical protein